MQIREALDRLDTIHNHLTRSEEYRGFWTVGVVLVGILGLAAAALQPVVGVGTDRFVLYWVSVAGLCGLVSGGPVIYSYLFAVDEFARRRTRRVLAQFLPCLLAGAALTYVLPRLGPGVVPLLPGVWALVFGLGLQSTRPHLPAAITWLASFYLAAGCLLLAWGSTQTEPSPWAVGGVFGVGHFAAAMILARSSAENDDV